MIIWAYMNEVMLRPLFKKGPIHFAAYCKEVNRQAKAIEKLIRDLDPNRYTLIPCHGSILSYKEAGLFEVPKIVGLNLYQGWYSGIFSGFEDYLDNFHKQYPNSPIIITEYDADVDSRLHSYLPERFDHTFEYENLFHEHYYKAIQERDFVFGAAWNLNDFYSESRASAVPHVNNKGITGLNREKKDIYFLYQVNLLKNPFVAIGSNTWSSRAGIETQSGICSQSVAIYNNLPKVEVTLNTTFLGSFIFQTQSNGIEAFKADVSDEQYEIYFYWAHLIPVVQKEALAYNLGNTSTYENATNYFFDVAVNGNTILQNLDIPNKTGSERAIIKSTQINVKEGKGITVKFDASMDGKTYLNAIRTVKIN